MFLWHYGFINPDGSNAHDQFFMLRGFSIEHSHSGEQTLAGRASGYYRKCFVSVFPLYWLGTLFYVIFQGKASWQQNILLFPAELLGIQSVFRTLFPVSHNAGAWFISCIIICYLVFPLLHDLVKSMGRKLWVMAMLVVESGILIAARYLLHHYMLFSWISIPMSGLLLTGLFLLILMG